MDEEKIKQSEVILKKILGKEKFKKLLDLTPDILDKKIGKNHSLVDGIVTTKLINKFIVYIGYNLAKGMTLYEIEKNCNPIYKVLIHINSFQEIYDLYKEYIDIVKIYYTNNKE